MDIKLAEDIIVRNKGNVIIHYVYWIGMYITQNILYTVHIKIENGSALVVVTSIITAMKSKYIKSVNSWNLKLMFNINTFKFIRMVLFQKINFMENYHSKNKL